MKNELIRAFQNKEFILYYQPIVNSKGRILGGEALIRWQHPEKGMIPPNDFISVLEENQSITTLTRWVIFQVRDQLKRLKKYKSIYLTVNLSAKDFEEEHLPEAIFNALADEVSTDRLKFEITESACVQDIENSLAIMDRLKKNKLELLIDDFGTGHSSLGYLYRIPAGMLKIDKIFVDNIVNDKAEYAYLKDIINLIKNQGKEVLIEGVSSKEQFQLLNNGLCDHFQGFYFSEPVPAELFEKYIEKDVTLPLNERLA